MGTDMLKLLVVLSISLLCLSLPTTLSFQVPLSFGPGIKEPMNLDVRPLVLWHGLGDSHNSGGILEFMSLIKKIHPGIFVHSIYIEESLQADQQASWMGKIDDQLEVVAEQLRGIEELRNGFDAIGFSQGGHFMRAYIERYNNPSVNNLITFGSPHMGIADIPTCSPRDIFCKIARNAMKNGVYSTWAQNHIIPAQYFRDVTQLPQYYASNQYLTSINNELPNSVNATYAQNFTSLSNLVLVLFTRDRTVVPKESAWFGSYAPPSEEEHSSASMKINETIIPMRLQPLYVNDLIGLRSLDESGRVFLETCEGEHMELSRNCWEPLVKQFAGGKLR